MIRMMSIGEDIESLQTLQSHSSDVTCCDFGGNFCLASGSGDKTVRVWEWSPGEGYVDMAYSPLMGHKYGVTCIRFSPQGTMLATSSVDGSTMLWNVRSGVRIHTFIQVSGGAVRTCRFTPDSTLLITAGDDGSVCVWDLVHRSLVRTFQQHEGTIQSVSLTPDSYYLLTTCTLGVMKLWHASDRSDTSQGDAAVCLASIDDAHDLGVVGSDFSPLQELLDDDGSLSHRYLLATCGNDNEVKLWHVVVGKYVKHLDTTPCDITLHQCLEGHTSALMCVRFSPGGNYLASSSLDKTVRVWEVNGNCVAVLEGHSRYVTSCAFSRDSSLLASGSNDKSVMVWNLGGNLSVDSELVKPCSALSHFGNNNGECCNLQEQEVVKQAEVDENTVKVLQRLEEHGGTVNTCAFHSSVLLASGSGDKMVRLWVRNDEGRFEESESSPMEGHRYGINQVEFSPSGELLASCSLDGSTILWDAGSGRRGRPSFQVSGSGVRTCRFSPDGHLLVTAGDDEKAFVWSTHTMEQLMVVEGHNDAIAAAAFTPDSQYLVTACSDGHMKLWSVAPCSEQCMLTQEDAHDLGVQSCDFSPTEGTTATKHASNNMYRYLLATCGNDSLVKLWYISTQPSEDVDAECILWRQLAGHGGNVMCVRFTPLTGEILASTATDKTIRLWNVYSGECVHVLENDDSMVTACAFSGDSSLLATGSLDGSLLVWELPQQLVFKTIAATRLRSHSKRLLDWSTEDVKRWLKDLEMEDVAERVRETNLTGGQILTLCSDEILDMLQIEDEEQREKLNLQLYWLRKEDAGMPEIPLDMEIPHEFLCPITHEIMHDPVICSDGFTYERAAINEWFLSGKFTSPMTNAQLTDTKLSSNTSLKTRVCQFLYGETVP
ncbi:WD repeat, SAM and U-box domain-containing protein 1-like [Periplaneta americana]|uniref:WD repeat, SAM and U-box domain-containing protein 1-like n=1 Tax=Periplaneta americana TaxID=6978 RepID=UPI0037E917AB